MKLDAGNADGLGLRFLYFTHIPLLDGDNKSEYIIQKLAEQIHKKVTQYEASGKELNDIIYSVLHDLRAPLRRIDGFSQELMNKYLDQLDETGAHYLKRVRPVAQDMANQIDDLLKLSRRKLEIKTVDLGKVAKSTYDELLELGTERNVNFHTDENHIAEADEGLLKVMLMNLFSNALNFTSKEEDEFFFMRDNSVGFDPAYSDKLFKAFGRLYSQKEFQGTGIGLSTVKRIINLHGSKIPAESTRRIPVVILTSSQEEEDIIKGYDLGANSYVRKPVDYQDFVGVVNNMGIYWLAINK